MASEPSEVEIHEAGIKSALLDVHTAMSAEILTYDASTQTCSCRPLTKRAIKLRDDRAVRFEELPVISNVRVLFPRGGGFLITWPLEKGDVVELVFAETDETPTRESGKLSEPADLRRFGLSHPVAIPGLGSNLNPLLSASSDGMVIGLDNEEQQIRIGGEFIKIGASAVEFAAMANKVDDQLSALAQMLQTWSTANPSTGITTPAAAIAAIAALSAAVTTLLALPWPTTVAAQITKVQ